jgi:hypothetical protein
LRLPFLDQAAVRVRRLSSIIRAPWRARQRACEPLAAIAAVTVEPIGELLEPSPALARCDARGGDREMGESTVMSTP